MYYYTISGGDHMHRYYFSVNIYFIRMVFFFNGLHSAIRVVRTFLQYRRKNIIFYTNNNKKKKKRFLFISFFPLPCVHRLINPRQQQRSSIRRSHHRSRRRRAHTSYKRFGLCFVMTSYYYIILLL